MSKGFEGTPGLCAETACAMWTTPQKSDAEDVAFMAGFDCAARQLAEQRAELLEALQLVRGYVVTMKGHGHEYQQAIDAAIANATQQRNATGGEG